MSGQSPAEASVLEFPSLTSRLPRGSERQCQLLPHDIDWIFAQLPPMAGPKVAGRGWPTARRRLCWYSKNNASNRWCLSYYGSNNNNNNSEEVARGQICQSSISISRQAIKTLHALSGQMPEQQQQRSLSIALWGESPRRYRPSSSSARLSKSSDPGASLPQLFGMGNNVRD